MTARHLTAAQAAARCHVTILTMATYRQRGTGPRWVRVGKGRGRILYDAADVSRWVAERMGHRLHVDERAATDAQRYDAAVARVEMRLAALNELCSSWEPRLRHDLWGLRESRARLDLMLERVARIQADLTPEGIEARAQDLALRRQRARYAA